LNKEKNVKWPVVKNTDFFPYVETHLVAWSGFYTSRPGFKKQIKVYSSLFHSQAKLFAYNAIEQKSKNQDIKELL
jgi:hypothetical protein